MVNYYDAIDTAVSPEAFIEDITEWCDYLQEAVFLEVMFFEPHEDDFNMALDERRDPPTLVVSFDLLDKNKKLFAYANCTTHVRNYYDWDLFNVFSQRVLKVDADIHWFNILFQDLLHGNSNLHKAVDDPDPEQEQSDELEENPEVPRRTIIRVLAEFQNILTVHNLKPINKNRRFIIRTHKTGPKFSIVPGNFGVPKSFTVSIGDFLKVDKKLFFTPAEVLRYIKHQTE